MPEPKEKSGGIICPSTKEFYKESKANPKHSPGDFIHGYIYGRWIYAYISVAKGKHPLTKILGPLFKFFTHLFPDSKAKDIHSPEKEKTKGSFADGYHAKVMPLEKASKLIKVDQPLNMPDLEQVVPYKRARDIILNNPDHIAVLKCPCRAAMDKPCQPEEVCLVIGEPFTSFIVEHHPDKARRITQKEAIEIMTAEDERGHVHHAFFKDAMLDRFYAICNCCSCCCGAINAHRNGTPMLASSGFISEINAELCIGCETCFDNCQFDAIEMIDGMVKVIYDKCMGCGVCVNMCEQEAISLNLSPAKGKPLDICALQKERKKGTDLKSEIDPV
jgi:Pyruvate/2-oxoacid:ferredoxin oxidoreductase delta subunit